MNEHPAPPGGRRGWYGDPRGRAGQRWWDGDTWTVATRPDPAIVPPDPYKGLERAPGYNNAAVAGFGLGLISLLWNPMALIGIAGVVLSLLGRRRVATWLRENYRPTGGRIATWGLVMAGISTTFTLVVRGFFR
jgi:hypothetical protein